MKVFLREPDEYVRNIDVLANAVEQYAIYFSKLTDKPVQVAKDWLVKELGPGGRFEYKSPMCTVNLRDPESGDRVERQMSLAQLMKTVVSKELISAASLTFYLPPHIKRSYLSMFIERNIARRGAVKKEMFVALANKDFTLAANKKNEQNSFKTLNNALSGAHSSPFTILHNKSSHSMLTSTCRSATSYGNANNEKLLAGSRHYWSPAVIVNNILATIQLTDFDAFIDFATEYNIHLPTVDETMDVIHYSADLYIRNEIAMRRVRELVSKLTDYQRAAFVYIGDLYHFRKFNDHIIKSWIDELITPVSPDAVVNIEEVEANIDGDLIAYVSLLRVDIVGHRNFNKIKSSNPAGYMTLMATCEHVTNVCNSRGKLIRELLTTANVPASIAKMPDVLRRVSLVSDTDSTMATLEKWAEWHCGKTTGEVADAVADTMIFMSAQNIAHMMARMSINMGVEKKYLHRYRMKNEYKFGTFVLTSKAKHYFSSIISQEGTVKEEPELEVKGVALRTSNIPHAIMDEFRETLLTLCNSVSTGERIQILPLLERIAELENDVYDSIMAGKYTYLKTGQIKDKAAYKNPESSSFAYHEWWSDTFAPKYGSSGEPSYGVVKAYVTLGSKTAIKRWIASIKDRDMAGRIEAWHTKYPDRKYSQLLIPESIAAADGIPKEILDVVDYRRAIFASVEPYYHALECFGIRLINDNRTRLVSDYYGKRATQTAA